jgi:hypothetical protein
LLAPNVRAASAKFPERRDGANDKERIETLKCATWIFISSIERKLGRKSGRTLSSEKEMAT